MEDINSLSGFRGGWLPGHRIMGCVLVPHGSGGVGNEARHLYEIVGNLVREIEASNSSIVPHASGVVLMQPVPPRDLLLRGCDWYVIQGMSLGEGVLVLVCESEDAARSPEWQRVREALVPQI